MKILNGFLMHFCFDLMIMGTIADHVGLPVAFLIPIACFASISWYERFGTRPSSKIHYGNNVAEKRIS